MNISRWAVGLVGLVYLIVTASGMFFAYTKIAALNMPFIGEAWVHIGEFAMWKIELEVIASLGIGLYMAAATCIYLIVIALLRNKIVGKSE